MIPLADVTTKIGSGATPRGGEANYKTSGVPLIRSMNVHFDGFRADGLAYLDDEQATALKNVEVRSSDVLLNITGASIGRVTVAPQSMDGARVNQHVCIIRPDGRLDPSFLRWHLASPLKQRLINSVESGATRQALTKEKILGFEVPLPSVSEQQAVVAEIEKQFSRLDEAVAGLQRVKANLKRYKAAVLKSAVAGRLVDTEADLARREGRDYETGAQLLQRILETRRRQWQGKGKYKEPAAPDTTDLPELPEGWVWARLDSLAALKGGITVDSKRQDPTARAVPYLRVANVQRGYLDLSEVKTINAPATDIAELRLQHGDILFNEGGDRDKLGRGWIWEGQLSDCIHQNHVFRARLVSGDILPRLVSWWGNSFGKDYFQREGKQTTNLASINLGKLSAFPVPLPPLPEQHRIVAEVDRLLSIAREAEAEVDANLRRAQGLRQAILQRAFSVSVA